MRKKRKKKRLLDKPKSYLKYKLFPGLTHQMHLCYNIFTI